MTNAQGWCKNDSQGYVMVDIPGCYSLMAHSTEEEVARDFICFENPDAVVVVCDATCVERNLNLVLQIMEANPHVVVCVNLMDEACKKSIRIRLKLLEKRLGVPVVGTVARSKHGLNQLYSSIKSSLDLEDNDNRMTIHYPEYIEDAIARLYPVVDKISKGKVETRWLCARLLDGNDNLLDAVKKYLTPLAKSEEVLACLENIHTEWKERGISQEKVGDEMATVFIKRAEQLCRGVVIYDNKYYDSKDRKLDSLFTSKLTGFPIMFFILLATFWLTITGANYPSAILSKLLFGIEDWLSNLALSVGAPGLLIDLLFHGVYRVLAWVVSVMLPPMAIFFPLFTLLEDFGYLPRVALNLDRLFKTCSACGKQALTM